MKKILLLILILYCPVNATITMVSQDTTITTGTAADTFRLANNIYSASGHAIDISGTADSITLDLNGDTIFYDTSGASIASGVRISNVDYVTVMNGVIISGYEDTTTLSSSWGVTFGGSKGTLLYNLKITVGGYNADTDIQRGINNIRCGNGSAYWMNKIVACTLSSTVVGFYRRDTWPAEIIYQDRIPNDALISDPTTEYHLWVDSTRITNAVHSGVLAYSGATTPYTAGVVWVSNSHITVDARNDGPYTGYRYGESYGIALEHVEHFRIWNNTIDYDSNYFGGMGIFVANSRSTDFPNEPSVIHDNIIKSSIGPLATDTGGTTGHSTCIRIRINSSNINVYDNELYAYSDTISTTYFRTGQAIGVWLGYDDTTNSVNNITMYNNTIRVSTDGHTAYGMTLIGLHDTATNISHDNHIYSNNTIFGIANIGDTGNTTAGFLSYNDTLDKVSPSIDFTTYRIGFASNRWNCWNNAFRDNVLLNGTSDTNIVFSNNGVQSFDLYRTLNITIQDTLSNPIQNAICTTWNNLGAVVLIDTSDANGLFSGITRYWYESRTDADSTSLRPFDLRIWNAAGTDSVGAYDWVMINESGSRDTTLTLSATVGEATTYNKKYRKLKIRRGKI